MTFKFLAQLSHFITMLFGIALGMTICLLYQYTTKIFIFYLTSIILLIVTKLYYLGKGYSWYKPARWLYVGFFSIQTSDIARFSVILYMAYYADKKRDKLKDFQLGLLPALGILSLIMTLIII